MKLKINILLVLLILINFNNKIVTNGEYQPSSTPSEFPFEDIAQFSPAFAIYNSIVPENWKLNNGDYLTLVRGGICSIPVVGALLDSVFSIFWNKLYPQPEKYVTKEDFEKRMNELAEDMRNYTNSYVKDELDKLIIRNNHIEYGNVRQCAQNYKNMVEIWNNQITTTNVTSSQLKDNLPVIYWIFLTKLEDSLRSFSDPLLIHRVGKVYLETAFMYISLLRDGHFNGVSMGLSSELVSGIPNKPIETFSSKLNDLSYESLNNVGFIFENIIKERYTQCKLNYNYLTIRNERLNIGSRLKKLNLDQAKNANNCSRTIKKIPNWSFLTSRILYSNVKNYNNKILFFKASDFTNDQQYFKSDLTINVNVSNTINVIDFRSMGKSIQNGHVNKNPWEKTSQVCDFVTGMVGLDYSIGTVSTYDYKRDLPTFDKPHFFNFKKGIIVERPDFEHTSTSYFFTNIILNEFTNKNVKFRIYITDGSFVLRESNFKIKVGSLKTGETKLTYHPYFRVSSGNDNESDFNFRTMFYEHLNIHNDEPVDIAPFKNITMDHGPDVRPRSYMETPFFNFDNCTRLYFEFKPVIPFSLNLLSLEIITKN